MTIIFFGSDDFAATHLEALVKTKHRIVGCVTPLDKPQGRGMKMIYSPVKTIAVENNIPVWQPADARDTTFLDQLKKAGADLFVVIAYGRILPLSVLGLAKKMAVNVHASLLPKYRGAAPINWAIMNGDEETGLTIIKMNEQMDAGDILVQEKISIAPLETAPSLRGKMIRVGPTLLRNAIQSIEEDHYVMTKQDSKAATLAPKLTKELGRIDWNKSARQIECLVRGLLPWPSAYTFYQGKMLKVLEAEVGPALSAVQTQKIHPQPGDILEVSAKGILVATSTSFTAAYHGSLLIKQVHLESAKLMTTGEFIRGHAIKPGEKLG
ncbi:MAG: methionyl-tRNA formyltransferase [Candidatus Omnitrophota bacterium]|nr:methionyl-tRNA formyltransferase [Candidatus Omnitrophota bacterium]